MKNMMAVPGKVTRTCDMIQQFISGYHPKELKPESPRDTCTSMFIAARSKQPLKCPSVRERMNKTWPIRTGKYYSNLKRKEVLTHATPWMNLEDIVLSEISPSQKGNY